MGHDPPPSQGSSPLWRCKKRKFNQLLSVRLIQILSWSFCLASVVLMLVEKWQHYCISVAGMSPETRSEPT